MTLTEQAVSLSADEGAIEMVPGWYQVGRYLAMSTGSAVVRVLALNPAASFSYSCVSPIR